MRIHFIEPTTPKYIYIHQDSNMMHLLVPLMGFFQNFYTQNTMSVREFFAGGAVRELTAYKDALDFDMAFLDESHPLYQAKASRLMQIKNYISAVNRMKMSYGYTLSVWLESQSKSSSKVLFHQSQPSVDFAEIVDAAAAWPNTNYYEKVRKDFIPGTKILPPTNDWIVQEVELSAEELSQKFLHHVAQGKQQEAETLLNSIPFNEQNLLTTPGRFTDYSGRTFNCTAYEYAYWAKDSHMRRMLERYMTEETKSCLLARINNWDSRGLAYQQNGQTHYSTCFDFTPFRNALQYYRDGYEKWRQGWKTQENIDAWMAVGMAQRDLPQHYIAEFCRQDILSLHPKHRTQDEHLPRDAMCYDRRVSAYRPWFPLSEAFSELGHKYAMWRAGSRQAMKLERQGPDAENASIDLEAMIYIDNLRTKERQDSLDFLRGSTLQPKEEESCTRLNM